MAVLTAHLRSLTDRTPLPRLRRWNTSPSGGRWKYERRSPGRGFLQSEESSHSPAQQERWFMCSYCGGLASIRRSFPEIGLRSFFGNGRGLRGRQVCGERIKNLLIFFGERTSAHGRRESSSSPPLFGKGASSSLRRNDPYFSPERSLFSPPEFFLVIGKQLRSDLFSCPEEAFFSRPRQIPCPFSAA